MLDQQLVASLALGSPIGETFDQSTRWNILSLGFPVWRSSDPEGLWLSDHVAASNIVRELWVLLSSDNRACRCRQFLSAATAAPSWRWRPRFDTLVHLAQSAGVLVAGDGQATAGPQQSTLQTKQNLTRFSLPFAWSQRKDNMAYNIIMLALMLRFRRCSHSHSDSFRTAFTDVEPALN